MMQRYRFFDIFQKIGDSLSPKKAIDINGITFSPGVSFSRGISFGGIDFFQHQMHDIAAEEKDGILLIKGFYTK